MRRLSDLGSGGVPRRDALGRGDDRVRLTLDGATDYAILTTGVDGFITSWNAGAERLLGWGEPDVLGRSCALLHTAEDQAAGSPPRDLRGAEESGQFSTECWYVRKDGSRFWGRGQVMPLRGAGEPGFLMILRDETTQHEAELALQESEARWQMLQDAAGVGTWDWDTATGEMCWSAVNFRTRGREPIDDGGVRPVEQLLATLHPDDRARVKGELAAALTGGEPFRSEFRVVTAAGTVRWFAARGRLTPGASGTSAGRMFGINLDLTERRLADAARLANEEHLRLAMEAGTLSTFDLDLATDRAVRSARHDQIFGYAEPLAEWGFEIMLQHVVEQDREAVARSFRDALETRSEWRLRCRIRRADDGAERWIEARGLPAQGPSDEFTRIRGVITDVTEQERAAEALRRLNETLETRVEERTRERDRLWRNSLDMLAVIGFDGLIQAVNPAWTETLGYAIEELVGRRLDRLIHPDEAGRALEAIEQCLLRGLLLRIEVRCRHRDGSWRWLSWTAASEEGRIYAIARDVTAERDAAAALRQAEEALHQSQKMEAVGQLTGGIAHDFNNLLTAVVANLELIERQPADADRVRRLAHAAREAAMRGAKLTGQLLAFSRTQRLEVSPVDINGLITGMRDLLARSVAPLAEVCLELGPEIGPALADANQIELAILNLAINARDAMPDGGTIRISTAPVTWPVTAGGELPPGDYVEISVADTGMGMSETVRLRAFEPFFTTKPAGQGTGLGLAQVYGIARQAGGIARIDSAAGEGTIVRLLLPRAPESSDRGEFDVAGESGLAHPQPSKVKAATLLIVDDDADVRDVIGESLEMLGYRVLLAENGEVGLNLLDTERPDLLLVDYAMPGMTGAEVAEAARARFPDLPIAFATGYSDSAALDAVCGEAAVLHKPFALRELKEVLERLLTTAG